MRADEQEALEEVGVLLVGVLVDARQVVDRDATSTLMTRESGSSSPSSGNWCTMVSALASLSTSLNSSLAWARLRATRRPSPSGSPISGGAVAGVVMGCSAMRGYPRS